MRAVLLTLLLCTSTACSLVGYDEQALSATATDSGASVDPSNATTDGGGAGPGHASGDGSLPWSTADASGTGGDAGMPVACTGEACSEGQHCGAGGTCMLACDPAKSTCDLDCKNAKGCDVRCASKATCDVDCSGATKCDVLCASGTTCLTVCTDSEDCSLSCAADSACAVDCRQGGKCNAISCAPTAICELKCDKGEDCKFAICERPKVCPNADHRVVVCNQECP